MHQHIEEFILCDIKQGRRKSTKLIIKTKTDIHTSVHYNYRKYVPGKKFEGKKVDIVRHKQSLVYESISHGKVTKLELDLGNYCFSPKKLRELADLIETNDKELKALNKLASI